MAGEISLERQNLAHSSNGGDFQLESQQHWREENVLFSVVEAAVAAPMLTQTPAVVAADLRSNYFWYQSRSVRWLDKKLKDDARRRRKLVQHLLDIYSLGPGHKKYKKLLFGFHNYKLYILIRYVDNYLVGYFYIHCHVVWFLCLSIFVVFTILFGMSLAIKVHEILSLLMTHIITFATGT